MNVIILFVILYAAKQRSDIKIRTCLDGTNWIKSQAKDMNSFVWEKKKKS